MPSPLDSTSDAHALESGADKQIRCDIWGVLNFYRVHVFLTNWEHDKNTCSADLEKHLQQHCGGAENVQRFTCSVEDPKTTLVTFHIPWSVAQTLGDPPYGPVEDAIYDFSGSSKIRVKCRHPGL